MFGFRSAPRSRARWAVGLAACGMAMVGRAEESNSATPIEAGWQVQEIRYSYSGFNVGYNCDAAERRLKEMLLALGVHPQTRVLARGCNSSAPANQFFISVTIASLVPVADRATPSGDDSREQLLDRMDKPAGLDQTVRAQWKTIALAQDRKLRIKNDDCELLKGLRDQVLPKLSAKVVSDRLACVAGSGTSGKPQLTVSVLTPVADVDAQSKPAS